MSLNDQELNEHCLKIRQSAENLCMLLRERKIGMLWVALDEARTHAKQGMQRLLEIDDGPVYLEMRQDK